jgi:hypothetical protein
LLKRQVLESVRKPNTRALDFLIISISVAVLSIERKETEEDSLPSLKTRAVVIINVRDN